MRTIQERETGAVSKAKVWLTNGPVAAGEMPKEFQPVALQQPIAAE